MIYSSDQGFYIGDHGWYDKRWMYEESLKMPLIVKWPGVTKPGSRSQLMVQNLDYAETFLDIAGARRSPTTCRALSLVPLLKGKTPADWRKSIYYHYYEYPSVHMVPRHYGIRTETHKLMHFYQFGEEWEIYDLEADPDELTNLYGKPGTDAVTRRSEKAARRPAREIRRRQRRLRKIRCMEKRGAQADGRARHEKSSGRRRLGRADLQSAHLTGRLTRIRPSRKTPSTRSGGRHIAKCLRIINKRRGSQVVRQKFAKLPFAGSIPALASMFRTNDLLA